MQYQQQFNFVVHIPTLAPKLNEKYIPEHSISMCHFITRPHINILRTRTETESEIQNPLRENMISSAQNLGFLVCVLLFFAGILALGSSQAEVKKHVALFVFGDSIYDPGNNNFLNLSITYKKNYPPYGETFFKFPTGRASDGLLIPDFIGKLDS